MKMFLPPRLSELIAIVWLNLCDPCEDRRGAAISHHSFVSILGLQEEGKVDRQPFAGQKEALPSQ